MNRALNALAFARHTFVGAIVAFGLLTFTASAQAPLDVRVALVIGNSAYAGASLLNPANDARAMSDTLRGLGFTVVELRDGQKEQMTDAIARVRDALKGKQGVGMLYYAGHGLQLDWRNYMVPVDAKLTKAADVPAQTIDINSVIEAFKVAGSRMSILVLDACRDNPFGATASGKGLAPLDAPPGTFLAYATAPGNVAEDGDAKGGNGLYTQYLLEELKKPTVRIEDMFKRVRFQVRQKSQGRQIPWESTSLEDDFYFNQRAGDGRGLQDARQVGAGFFDQEKAAWDSIRSSASAVDYFEFLKRFPNGSLSELAQFRLDQLDRPGLQAQPGRGHSAALSSGLRRYEVGDLLVYKRSDLVKNAALSDAILTVTAATDERVEFNGGSRIWDQMGNTLANDAGIRSPPKVKVPADLGLGKKWRSTYQFFQKGGVSSSTLTWDFKVTAYESVTVPAGTFMAFRVDGTSTSSNRSTQTQRYWIDPRNFLFMKDELIQYFPNGTVYSASRWELARYQPAARR